MSDRIERKLTQNEDNIYDYTIDTNGDFTHDLSFDTDILVSLFVDARADESEIAEPEYRRGWIGDVVTVLQGHQLGSKLWLVEQERMTQDVLNKISSYVKESLNWVITLNYGQRVQVEVNREDLTRASVNIRIYVKNDNVLKFTYQIWQNSQYKLGQ
jgi:phage gp46-like protein